MAKKDEFDQFRRNASDSIGLPSDITSSPRDDFSKVRRGGEQPQSGINWNEIAFDIAKTPYDMLSGVYKAGQAAPEGLPKAYNELDAGINQPYGRKTKNLLAGVGKFGDVLNQAPANARDYLIRKGAPEDFMSWLKRPEMHDYQEALGLGEVQPGDIGMQGVGSGIAGAALTGGTGLGTALAGGLYEAGENRNPLTPAGGVGAMNLAGRAFQGVQNMRGRNIAQQTLEARNAARATSSANYNRFNAQTEAGGVNAAYQAPRNLGRTGRTSNQARILNDVPDAYTENFRNYINNGLRFEDALPAVSDLRGYAAKIRNLGERATPEQLRNMRASNHVAAALDRAGDRAFVRSGNPALRQQLQQIRDFHANEVIPYKPHNLAFSQFERNRINPERLVEDLMTNDEFMHMLSNRFSGFRNRRVGKAAGKALALTGGIGGTAVAGKSAWDALFGENE